MVRYWIAALGLLYVVGSIFIVHTTGRYRESLKAPVRDSHAEFGIRDRAADTKPEWG
jgi:hypothetical protein